MTRLTSKQLLIDFQFWIFKHFNIRWIINYLNHEIKYWLSWVSLTRLVIKQNITKFSREYLNLWHNRLTQ